MLRMEDSSIMSHGRLCKIMWIDSVSTLIFIDVFRYRDRYWRESAFRGMELVRKTLEEVYGADKVSMVSATFRWLNHHSAMKPEYNGKQ